MKKFLYLIAIVFCGVVVSCTNNNKTYDSEGLTEGIYSTRKYFDTIEVAKDSFIVNVIYTYNGSGIAVENIHSFTTK